MSDPVFFRWQELECMGFGEEVFVGSEVGQGRSVEIGGIKVR